MISSKEYIEEDWERIADQEKLLLSEEREEEVRELIEWYQSQEGDIIYVSQSIRIEELPF